MRLDALASILEEEFALAFEVKDEKALRRSLTLLTGGMVAKSEYEKEQNSLSSDIKLLVIEMKEGFRRMDERFEAVDKRFEAVDKRFEAVDKHFEAVDKRFEAEDKRFESIDSRFNRLTGLISLGFLVITVLITVFQFLG